MGFLDEFFLDTSTIGQTTHFWGFLILETKIFLINKTLPMTFYFN
jgi:hypothetical protein